MGFDDSTALPICNLQLTRFRQFLIDSVMKSASTDVAALKSILASSKSDYSDLHPLHSLDPADIDKAIAELRENLRLQ
jgi:hypothetical protein